MRLTFNTNQVKLISLALLKTYKKDSDIYISLQKQINDNKNRDISKKQKSTQKATQTRKEAAINKIENAVNLMRLENKKINVNSVSNESKVAYNTVKKYLPELI